MVEAVGVDLYMRIENTKVIDFAGRSKLEKRQKRGFEVRNKYTGLVELICGFQYRKSRA